MAAGGGHLLVGPLIRPSKHQRSVGEELQVSYHGARIVWLQFFCQTLFAAASSRPPFAGSGFYVVPRVLQFALVYLNDLLML